MLLPKQILALKKIVSKVKDRLALSTIRINARCKESAHYGASAKTGP
jgi:hypothetical protein